MDFAVATLIIVFVGSVIMCGRSLYNHGLFSGFLAGRGRKLSENEIVMYDSARHYSALFARITGGCALGTFIGLLGRLIAL